MTEDKDKFYNEFNGAFWLTMATAVFGFGVALMNAMIKSRCKTFSCCCGLFSVERNWEDDVISNAGDGRPPIINNPSSVNLEEFESAHGDRNV